MAQPNIANNEIFDGGPPLRLEKSLGLIKPNCALDVQHFSATTDLYQLVSNVYQMKPFPIATQDLIALIVVTLLPFLPALLFEIPLDEILSDLVKLMF